MLDLWPECLTWRRTFPGTPDQVPHAHRFVRHLLSDAPRADDAELITAELCANALQRTSSAQPCGTFVVEVVRTTTTITVAVYDCGWGGIPRFGIRREADGEQGRGLSVVSAVADRVGHEGDDAVGHKVWATMTLA